MTDREPFDPDEICLDDLQEVEPFVDGLPLHLDPAGPGVEQWTPPPLPLEIEMEHLIGGDLLDILPSKPFDRGVRELEREIRQLPATLGAIVRRLKDLPHRSDLVELIDWAVLQSVPPTALRCVKVPGTIYKTRYLPEIYRNATLTKLAADTTFGKRLKARVAEIKHDGHLVNTYGGPPGATPKLPQCVVPSFGTWHAESWLGLSTSSLPEAMPEEVAVAIAQRTWRRRHLAARAPKQPPGRVLHWGALNGTLAHALQSTAPLGSTLVIHEVDTVGQPQSREWVGQRFTRLPLHGGYDLVAVHVPPPGEGANHLRNQYKDLPGPPNGDVFLEDLGRRGPKKWRRRVRKLINEVTPKLKPDGELVLLLPTAIRTAPTVNGYPQWGYEPRDDLLAGIVELLANHQLRVVADLAVVEENPLNQPFFVDRRCPWRCVISSLNTGAEDHDDDSVDAFLADVGVDLD